MKVALISGATTTVLDQTEVSSLLAAHNATRVDSDGGCNRACNTCPSADDGCAAPTEGATIH